MDTETANKILSTCEQMIGKNQLMAEKIDSLEHTLKSKINPQIPEFVSRTEAYELFPSLTRAVFVKWEREGKIRKYKLTGPRSTTVYRYIDLISSIESGLQNPPISARL